MVKRVTACENTENAHRMTEARRKPARFLPLRDSLTGQPRYLAARVTFHYGLPSASRQGHTIPSSGAYNLLVVTALARDTSPEVERRQIERWRNMSPAEKAALVTGLTGAAHAMAVAGIRHRYPNATSRERILRLAIVLLGTELARKAYPDIATLEEA